jgi:hypothetical protein
MKAKRQKEKRINPALIRHLNRLYRTEDPAERRKRAIEGVNRAFAEFV